MPHILRGVDKSCGFTWIQCETCGDIFANFEDAKEHADTLNAAAKERKILCFNCDTPCYDHDDAECGGPAAYPERKIPLAIGPNNHDPQPTIQIGKCFPDGRSKCRQCFQYLGYRDEICGNCKLVDPYPGIWNRKGASSSPPAASRHRFATAALAVTTN